MIGAMIFAMLISGGAAAYGAHQANEQQKDFMKAQKQSELEREQKRKQLGDQMRAARARVAAGRRERIAGRQQTSKPAAQTTQKPRQSVIGSYLSGGM